MNTRLRELWAALVDAAECGNWVEHLRAWWDVARGRITPETRVTLEVTWWR